MRLAIGLFMVAAILVISPLIIQAQEIQFAPAVNYVTGDTPRSVFASDLDRDGDNDLAVANGAAGTVSILMNNGDDTFQPPVNYFADVNPYCVIACDLDGDGNNDLAVTNLASGDISILKNNGDGTFQNPVNIWIGNYTSPSSIVACDLDNDGDNELAVANGGSNNVSILINNGDGSFQAAVNYDVGGEPLSIVASDLDGDGDYDLATANNVGDNISVLKNNGDGVFTEAVYYESGNYCRSICAYDIDGDGDNDLLAVSNIPDLIMVLENNGDGTFPEIDSIGVGGSPQSIFVSDLDGDRIADLALANWGTNDVSILRGNGDGTFQTPINYGIGDGPNFIFGSDLDGDYDIDIISANYYSDNISVLINRSGPYCHYLIGDVNGSGSYNGLDVTYGVTYLKGGPPPPYQCECTSGNTWYVAGDVNGSCNFNGVDVTYMVAYFKGGPGPIPCHDCPPSPELVPLLSTVNVSGATLTTAECGGTITSDGGAAVTARGVCWSTNPTPTVDNSKTTDGAGVGSYTSSITGLTDNTTYHVRAYATNSVGTGYGNIKSFSTLPLADTVTDIDGNVYQTVTIGSQVWMAENLKVTHYRNGDSIPNITDGAIWAGLITGAYCNYNNDTSIVAVYGKLYNWYAVADSRNIAPLGWHVASNDEWQTLVDYLGGELVAGGKLKEAGTAHWWNPNAGATNESGFTALPGGCRGYPGDYYNMCQATYFWSSTGGGGYAWQRRMHYGDTGVTRYMLVTGNGFSVRCVKD